MRCWRWNSCDKPPQTIAVSLPPYTPHTFPNTRKLIVKSSPLESFKMAEPSSRFPRR